MSKHRVPPHNIQAEESLLGAMLLSKDVIAAASPMITAADFYRKSNGVIYDVIMRLYNEGSPCDPVTVADRLSRDNALEFIGGSMELMRLQANTPATSSGPRYAKIIAGDAGVRRVIRLCDEMADLAYEGSVDGSELITMMRTAVASLEVPLDILPEGFMSVDDWMERPQDQRAKWVIPGLLIEMTRLLIVATEGFGKTMLLQQLALCAAQGVHPFAADITFRPITTLMVDAENPSKRIDDGFKMITPALMNDRDWKRDQAYLWTQQGGIDLRSRAHRLSFEAVLTKIRPELVCIGPLYKLYQQGGDEGYGHAAMEVQHIFDDLRTRYEFALVMETHAPQEQHGVRSLRPSGAAEWVRWADLGFSFSPDPDLNHGLPKPIHFVTGNFRGDRYENAWPVGISKSKVGLPWAGRHADRRWQQMYRGEEPINEDEYLHPVAAAADCPF